MVKQGGKDLKKSQKITSSTSSIGSGSNPQALLDMDPIKKYRGWILLLKDVEEWGGKDVQKVCEKSDVMTDYFISTKKRLRKRSKTNKLCHETKFLVLVLPLSKDFSLFLMQNLNIFMLNIFFASKDLKLS